MTAIRRTSLADQAAELLHAKIQSGEWPVGTKLPGETTLAPMFDVGRSTMREAIRQLAGRGILVTRQGSGVFVESIDEARTDWDKVLQRAHITEVLEARLAIEGEAATLAAARRTPTDLDVIRRSLELRNTARADAVDLVDADMAFHRTIVVASHNDILLGLFDSMAPRLRDAMIDMLRIAVSFGDDADHHTHTDVVEAIAAREPERAHALTRAHLLELSQSMDPST
ncbi:FadR family transcriptional regulator [Rhodococcus fascians]|nr:FadR family transcriptional regulator [Rhodococcus fascians]MBY4235517.1 FadR family transcriptional regulator [Rhodococcus fascians]MBY4251209.1 FadR family transcriptional regulator [Rhodococcus fascians]MBY4266864.1 FadR family transcriptional regulator [Rhodococcus fascians]